MGKIGSRKFLGFSVTSPTNELLSRVGCLYRREGEIISEGCGRPVSLESHDEAYKNIPDTIDKLVNSKKFESIHIVTREGLELAKSQDTENLRHVYEDSRNKLTTDMLDKAHNKIKQVIINMNSRNAKEIEMKEAMELKNQIISKLSSKLSKSDYVLIDVKTGKKCMILNSSTSFIKGIGLINKKLAAYLESDGFKKALPQHLSVYTATDLIKIITKIPNAPKIEMHESEKWAKSQNINLENSLKHIKNKSMSF